MTNGDGGQTRREFLMRSARAAAAVAVTWAGGAWLWRRGRRTGQAPIAAGAVIPNFSVPSAGKRMAIVTGADRLKTVGRALEGVGGISAFIKKGDRVAIKVNAAFATPAMLSATTNPELAAELVRLCLAAGARSVAVLDNPINDAESCFALTGIGEAVRKAGAQVIMPREGLFRRVTLAGGRLIRDWPAFTEPLARADKLIGVTPLKHHSRSGASMTMKNFYGLLGGRRNRFHQDINGIIMELAQLVRPTFVVLDGTTAMMTNGPTGGSLADLKATNTMIVSTDPVAADAFGATVLGNRASDLPYIGRAAAAGAGIADFESLKPMRARV
ncbi:MAG: DUF362 domain-containing protein [Candidatus Coatesbacteria bacterium]